MQILPVSGDTGISDFIETGSFCRLYHVKTKTFIHADGREELNALDEHTLAQCIAKNAMDDDLLEEKVAVSFRSKATFEDLFKVHRIHDDDVDDFNNVMGWRNLIELVRNATTPTMSALFPSQQGRSKSRRLPVISKDDLKWTYEQNGKRLIFAGMHLFDDLAEFVLDKDGKHVHHSIIFKGL